MWKFFFISPIYPIYEKKVFISLILRCFVENEPGIENIKLKIFWKPDKNTPLSTAEAGCFDLTDSFSILIQWAKDKCKLFMF